MRTPVQPPPPLTFVSRAYGAGDAAAIGDALGADIARRFSPADAAPYALLAYHAPLADEAAKAPAVAGLIGLSHWRWLYIRQVWVSESYRGRGVGRALLAQAEEEARARGCVGLYLDTFDPETARYYERCGFVRCGEIPDFPPGHSRTFLRKPLPDGGSAP